MKAKKLFFLLILLLPLNLGKHFVIKDSYVLGLLIDYLIPTIFVQDILVFLIILFWVSDLVKKGSLTQTALSLISKNSVKLLVFFIFSVFLSVLDSQRIWPSLYSFLRLTLYSILALYIAKEYNFEQDARKTIALFLVSVFLVAVLGLAQFVNKGSVFDNYLFFGEQPYSLSTPLVAKDSFFGRPVLPPYGLFRHPNILSVFLVFAIYLCIRFATRTKLKFLALFVMFSVFLATLSYFSWLSLVVIFSLELFSKEQTAKIPLYVCLLIFPFIFLFFPKLLPFQQNISYLRREEFLKSAYYLFLEKPLYGVGHNNITLVVEKYMNVPHDLRFTQPVHNVSALIAAESGLFSFIFYILFVGNLFVRKKNPTIQLLLVAVVFLSGFDHYFFTIHQTQLLFWIVAGLSLV
ncbi:hypothetical protein A3K34_04480 [candidate division WWE3 bacterium RIFOXYC1_FULL_40_10]|uniref:O-antigen ligase-related domain-containing protein n=1 Tax=candidate division WWE3 bacterium RIFOXYA2_FULL_46_9 TaxID=1802636 RepID=A0A1F4W121_UNCKA|nr:MAG: hypothetical protein A3K58_04480 [candidate division WWE3 bacterium RIFOXYB1_FULL_40_22]OGC62099.1 MAG: hypothetical protein A3K37_04480 [candidate division WWE3 bacterium RIFOXYA1_FULL_40_11]OGC63114.1 MAG: hypothetical protein A2264_00225 [candidate division WWE3 bacterium RIFOXYA2_FULL_46_9]OGC64958.1 MAG: hypothetical protein A2326_02885 [candidate division WWE3 bacterium RIFOXYB2_FULL_41_6]OGC66482.1 MAG: hypothetical protein A3K34_04480 [candidate division WWE3 bacterium RIFOXYC1_